MVQLVLGQKPSKREAGLEKRGSRCRLMKFFQDIFPILDIAMHVPSICFIAGHADSPKSMYFCRPLRMWDLRSLAASSLAVSFSKLSGAGIGGGRVQPHMGFGCTWKGSPSGNLEFPLAFSFHILMGFDLRQPIRIDGGFFVLHNGPTLVIHIESKEVNIYDVIQSTRPIIVIVLYEGLEVCNLLNQLRNKRKMLGSHEYLHKVGEDKGVGVFEFLREVAKVGIDIFVSVTNHEETNLNIFENLSGGQERQVGHDKPIFVGAGTIVELEVQFWGRDLSGAVGGPIVGGRASRHLDLPRNNLRNKSI